ncbi:hypothetical protein AcV5_008549 [Taiwanofungus camphoratus]|nr:hypothetical protein AcV5_008549 [Antrodia cinnamomea]
MKCALFSPIAPAVARRAYLYRPPDPRSPSAAHHLAGTVPLRRTGVRRRSASGVRHRPAARAELWVARAQGARRPRGAEREEVHLPCDLRGACWKRRVRFADDGDEDGGREVLDYHRHEEVDHERDVSAVRLPSVLGLTGYRQVLGLDGFTVVLVERGEGVSTKPIKTSYSATAGTAFVAFDNVRVPVENTLGEEGGGIFVMLSNFNHERWVMCCTSARSQRLIVEESLKWVAQRRAFGKPLSSQAVVRAKLAAMIARVEGVQSWLENLTYQMCHMSYKEQANKLAGQIAFLKMYSTRCEQATAADAVQLFGGRGITQSGMGKFVEHYHRTVPFNSLLGGAEDVLADLGVRQAMRGMPSNARL